MSRLRCFAATARQARLRCLAATARQARATATPVAQTFRSARAAWLERAVLTAAFVALGGSATLFACPMCFGAEESSLIDGAKLGILVMLGITFSVQGAFVAFFLYLRRRAKRIADADLDTEWSELQRTS